jgi:hypothetical protein
MKPFDVGLAVTVAVISGLAFVAPPHDENEHKPPCRNRS